MSLLEDITKGKYNAILLLIALLLVSRLCYTKNIEKMTSENDIRTRINTLFDIELDHVRNLSNKITELQGNNVVRFTNLIIDGETVLENESLSTSTILPSGIIIAWNSNNIPQGWRICDGTNNTPDLRGRFILGKPDNVNSGTVGGEEKVRLNVGNIPDHTHKASHFRDSTNVDSPGDVKSGGVTPQTNNFHKTYKNNDITSQHENMPPFYVLVYIIKI